MKANVTQTCDVLVHLKISGALHHGVNILQGKLSITVAMKEHIDLAKTKFLDIASSDGGKEQGLEAIRREADERPKNEATGALPSDAPKTFKAELNLVRHPLDIRACHKTECLSETRLQPGGLTVGKGS